MKILVLISAFSLITLITSCKNSAADSEVKIINGKIVEESDPSPVKKSLVILNNPVTGFLCTGTIVAPDLVLTAAHCKDSIDAVVYGRRS
ncbi:MAG: trypsin-like serine protease [Proteobacteria bacterium]|nr:MAG: trypsin-like serine protease [Pseudomonadota bacterium]